MTPPSGPDARALDDHRLAFEIASAAGRLLLALRDTPLLDAAARGAAGDALSQALIGRLLLAQRPGDWLRCEGCLEPAAGAEPAAAPGAAGLACFSATADPGGGEAQRVWIVDPLDGTREFGELGDARSDWAVHVALVEGGCIAAAAVALPALGLTLGTAEPPRPAPPPAGRPTILVSRSRPPPFAEAVAQRLGASLLPMGSAGAKAMAVLRGEAMAYLHAGGQYEWDSCAPVGVALAAGLHASRIDGSPCRYAQADPWMPDLLVCRPADAPALLAAIRDSR